MCGRSPSHFPFLPLFTSGDRLSSFRGSGQSQTAKRHLVHLGWKSASDERNFAVVQFTKELHQRTPGTPTESSHLPTVDTTRRRRPSSRFTTTSCEQLIGDSSRRSYYWTSAQPSTLSTTTACSESFRIGFKSTVQRSTGFSLTIKNITFTTPSDLRWSR